MKNISLSVVLLLFLSLSPPDADASDNASGPVGRLPVRAPDRASWKISFTYSAPPPSATKPPATEVRPVLIKERSVTKSGKIYQRLESFDNGTKIARWWVAGIVVGAMEDGSYLVSDHPDTGPFSYQNSDFPDLIWIGPDCYSRMEVVRGMSCYVFEKLRPRASDVEIQELSAEDRAAAFKDLVETTVWIDHETGLPVQESTPDRNETYTFLPPPATAVALPPEAARKLALHQARETQLTRRGPAP